jgi:DNA polymerase V
MAVVSLSQRLKSSPKIPLARPLTSDNVQLPLLSLDAQLTQLALPLFLSKVPAGFPSPADDHLDASIDLNQHYIQNPPATFLVRVKGHSMLEAGIRDGDMLVVDRSLTAKHGSIVVAVVDGEVTVKCLDLNQPQIWLRARNSDYADLAIKDGMDLQIWGVVAHVFHSLIT